jgi:hypothetical protein
MDYPSLGPETSASAFPYVFTRVYLCGHPDEYIRVDIKPSGRRQHAILPRLQGNIGSGVGRYELKFSLEKCRSCATQHRNQPNHEIVKDQGQKARGIGDSRNGFAEVLHRYQHGTGTDGVGNMPHRPMGDKEVITRDNLVWNATQDRYYERALRLRADDFDVSLEEERRRRSGGTSSSGTLRGELYPLRGQGDGSPVVRSLRAPRTRMSYDTQRRSGDGHRRSEGVGEPARVVNRETAGTTRSDPTKRMIMQPAVTGGGLQRSETHRSGATVRREPSIGSQAYRRLTREDLMGPLPTLPDHDGYGGRT